MTNHKTQKNKNKANKKTFVIGLASIWLLNNGCIAFAVANFPQSAQLDPNVQTNISGNTFQIQHGKGQVFKNDWNSFDVPTAKTVDFNFSQAGQVSINRVVGNQVSQIFGKITESGASGKVFLINPYGVLFGKDSSVNLGSFTVTTANMSSYDPEKGIYKFEQGNIPSSIINEGRITISDNGFIAIMAPVIKNIGTIEAKSGTIALLSGNKYTLTAANGQDISVSVDEQLSKSLVNQNEVSLISNSGTLEAAGGSVVLSSRAVDNIIQNAVNNTGIITANTVTETDGKIVLGNININTDQNVLTDGLIQANGVQGGNINIKAGTEAVIKGNVQSEGSSSDGGKIHVSAPILKVESANINASGASGGEILLGGDAHGENTGIMENAKYYLLSRDSVVKADATSDYGNGGKIINWADTNACVLGEFSAKGGQLGGDGGFIEASAKKYLYFDGNADLSAPNGKTGTLLLDPANITIASGGSGIDDAELNDNQILLADRPGASLTVSENKLETLAATANIILQASNNITMNDLSDNLLYLKSTTGSFTAQADADNNGVGAFSMNTGDTIRTEGGLIDIRGTGLTFGTLSTIGASGTLNGNINLVGNSGAITAVALKTGSGTINVNTTGSVNLAGIAATGAVTIDAGSVGYDAGAEASSVTLSGSTLNLNNVFSTGTVGLTADTYGVPTGALQGGAFNVQSFTNPNAITSAELDGIIAHSTFGGAVALGNSGSTGAISSTSADFDGQDVVICTQGTLNMAGITNAKSINIDGWTPGYNIGHEPSSVTLSGANLNIGKLFSLGAISLTSTSGDLTISGQMLDDGNSNIYLKANAGNITSSSNNIGFGGAILSVVASGNVNLGSVGNSSTASINIDTSGSVSIANPNAYSTITVDKGLNGTYDADEASSITITGTDFYINNLYSLGAISLNSNYFHVPLGTIRGGAFSIARVPGNNNNMNGTQINDIFSHTIFDGTVTIGSTGFTGGLAFNNIDFKNNDLVINTNGSITCTGITNAKSITVDSGVNGVYDAGAEAGATTLSGTSLNFAKLYTRGATTLTATSGDITAAEINVGSNALSIASPGAVNISNIVAASSIGVDNGSTAYTAGSEATNVTLSGPSLNIYKVFANGVINLTSTAGSIVLTSAQTANSDINLTAASGGVTTGVLFSNGTGNININTTGAVNIPAVASTGKIKVDAGASGYTAGAESSSITIACSSTLNLDNLYSLGTIDLSILPSTVFAGTLQGGAFNIRTYYPNWSMTSAMLDGIVAHSIFGGPVTIGKTGNTGTVTSTSVNFQGQDVIVKTTGTINLAGITNAKSINIDAGTDGYDAGAEANGITLSGTALNLGKVYSGSSGAINLTTAAGNLVANDIKTTNSAVTATATGGNLTINSITSGTGIITAKTLGTVNISDINSTGALVVDAGTVGYNAGSEASSVTLSSSSTLNLGKVYSNGNINAAATSDLSVASGGLIKTAGSGNSLILIANNFINNSGASALSAASGRWLIYASDPATSTINGLTYSKHYNMTYPTTPTADGQNYVLYSIAPILNILASDASKTYGDANPAFTSTASGFINGDTAASVITGSAALNTTADATSGAGTYNITPSVGTLVASLGYQFGYTNGTLTVDKRSISITANNASKTYGDVNPVFSSTVTGGTLVNADSLTSIGVNTTTLANNLSNAGNYDITASGALANYNPTYFLGHLVIGKKDLAVTANDANKTYGDLFNTSNLTSHFTGFVNGDNASNLDNTNANYAIASNAQNTSSGAGTYAINVSAGSLADHNYSFTTFNPGIFTVDKRSISITANNASKTYGDVNPVFSSTVTGGTLVNADSLTSIGVNTTTLANNLSNAGNYDITASGALANYNPTYFLGHLVIGKKDLAVTANDANKTYGDLFNTSNLTSHFTGFVNGDNASNLDNTNANYAIASNAQNTSSGAGTYAINVSAGSLADHNYSFTTFNPGIFTVDKRSISITANNASKTYGDVNPVFSSTVTGGTLVNADSLTSIGVNTTTLANNLSNAGNYDITASGALANYNPTYFLGHLVIGKKDLAVTANDANKTYGDLFNTSNLTSHFTGFVNGDNASNLDNTNANYAIASNAQNTSSGAGTYAINVSAGSLADHNYSFTTFNPGIFTVDKRSISITANNASKTYGDVNPVFSSTVTGGTLVNADSLTSIGVNTTTLANNLSNAGNYDITASGALANYNPTYFLGHLVIGKKDLAVTANDANKTYGDLFNTSNLTSHFTGFVNGDNASNLDNTNANYAIASNAQNTSSGAGTYAINVSAGSLADHNYSFTTFNPGIFTVDKRSISITANNASKTYGDVNPVFSSTVTGGTLVNADSLTSIGVNTTTLANNLSNAGNYDITASGALANYNPTYFLGHLVIGKKDLAVTANDANKTYGDLFNTSNLTSHFTGFVNGDNASNLDNTNANYAIASNAQNTSSGAGTYAINVSAGSLADHNYSFTTFNPGIFTVDKRSISITANNASKTYGDVNPVFSSTVTGGTLVNADSLTSIGVNTTTLANNLSNAGNYDITASGALANYNPTYFLGHLVIGKKDLAVTANDANKTYGDLFNTSNLTSHFTGFVNGDNASNLDNTNANYAIASNAQNTSSGAGTYAINVSAGSLADHNYSFTTFNPGIFTVDKRSISITANNASKTYGDVNPVFSSTVTGGTLVNADSLTSIGVNTTTLANNLSNAGNYDITASGALANYNPTYFLGHLVIGKKDLAVTANDANKTYGEVNPLFTANYIGLVNNDPQSSIGTLSISTSATTNSPQGSYELTPLINSPGIKYTNYMITYQNGIMTITGGNVPTPPVSPLPNSDIQIINQSAAISDGRININGYGSPNLASSGNAMGNSLAINDNNISNKLTKKVNVSPVVLTEGVIQYGALYVSDKSVPDTLNSISIEINKMYDYKDTSLFNLIQNAH